MNNKKYKKKLEKNTFTKMRKYYKKGLGCSNFEHPQSNQSKLTKPLVDHY